MRCAHIHIDTDPMPSTRMILGFLSPSHIQCRTVSSNVQLPLLFVPHVFRLMILLVLCQSVLTQVRQTDASHLMKQSLCRNGRAKMLSTCFVPATSRRGELLWAGLSPQSPYYPNQLGLLLWNGLRASSLDSSLISMLILRLCMQCRWTHPVLALYGPELAGSTHNACAAGVSSQDYQNISCRIVQVCLSYVVALY